MHLLETRIDLSAIAHNTAHLKKMVAPAQLMCVVKADAYNHGAARVAPVMAAHGADQFGVATIDEALALRRSGITQPILCWIWSPEQDILAAIAADIDLAIVSPHHAYALAGKNARVCVKVDTGLHRSGVDRQDWLDVFGFLKSHPELEVTGLFSHFACADDVSSSYTDQQLAVFHEAIECARAVGLSIPKNHIANSPATLSRPDTHCDMVRPGVAIYGMEPIAGRTHNLRPALSWVGKITVVKPIRAGEGSSYSLTWHSKRDGYIAVVPVGYADGLPRMAQDHLELTIRGHRYKQVGRVCMDQIVVDLGDNVHGVSPGDEAIIFGAGGMSATELAQRLGTINYEIICRPSGRSVRVYH
ncbi:alanine racemase [Corynebacterium sp. sy017]|uniref:alanine racemase n=1 Tax=unclassified Corynebacterium TaxID=2624378 RepID=UPI001186857E|nr:MULTISPECIES: alanine racemase [unclassified Corynebacterium]MBP3088661.1 alanine racemase [Corynebacterium sp. sy017]TSD92105.1 alanine racemase [Corynebacterium sp. SY003]